MRIGSIGNSFGFYTSAYASGATRGAARTAAADMLHGANEIVQPVEETPEVFGNDEVDRVPRTPKELQQDRRDAFEIMNSLTPRNADNLNAPLDFMTKSPFQAELPGKEKAEEIDFPFDGEKPEDAVGAEKADSNEECETCANRTYVDGSNESDVSFKSPGHISPEASAATVSAHEYEHVRNAMQEDKEDGKELVSVSVSLQTAVCPECGKTYVAGGKTRTMMRYGEENPYQKQQEAYNAAQNREQGFNIAA